jgi:hypothetical protein
MQAARARQTDAERAAALEASRLQMQATRARQLDAERVVALEANRLRMQTSRARQPDTERAAALEANRLRMQAARALQPDAERAADLEANRLRMQAARAQLPDAERAAAVETNRLRMQAARAQLPDAERAAAVETNRLQMQAARAQLPDAERAAAVETNRLRMQAARAKRMEYLRNQSARASGRPLGLTDSRRLNVLEAVRQRLGVPYDNIANIQLPAGGGLAREVAFAQELDKHIRREMPMWLCGVCSCIHARGDVQWVTWDDIPNVQLLRADIQSTTQVPRDAKVVYRRPLPAGMVAAPPPPPAQVYGARGAGAPPKADETVADVLSRVREPRGGAYGGSADTDGAAVGSGAYGPPTVAEPCDDGSERCTNAAKAGDVTYCMRIVDEVAGVSETLQVDCTFRVRHGSDQVRICKMCLQALRGQFVG